MSYILFAFLMNTWRCYGTVVIPVVPLHCEPLQAWPHVVARRCGGHLCLLYGCLAPRGSGHHRLGFGRGASDCLWLDWLNGEHCSRADAGRACGGLLVSGGVLESRWGHRHWLLVLHLLLYDRGERLVLLRAPPLRGGGLRRGVQGCWWGVGGGLLNKGQDLLDWSWWGWDHLQVLYHDSLLLL